MTDVILTRGLTKLSGHLVSAAPGTEAEVLRALADGLSNAEIATTIWIAPETVKTHIKSILSKLQVRDRTQAVVWAHRTGFVDTPGGTGGA